MARKQLGSVDDDLLARVDERASELGQTRRVFTERALLRALEATPGDTVRSDPASPRAPRAQDLAGHADGHRVAVEAAAVVRARNPHTTDEEIRRGYVKNAAGKRVPVDESGWPT